MRFDDEMAAELPGLDLDFRDEKERNSIQAWLIRFIHRYSAMNYKRFMEMGIHPGQLPVLRTLSEREGISQRELARELHVKPPTIAVTVKRMEKAELIYRQGDRADMRVNHIFLTEKGKNTGAAIESLMDENEQILMKGFSLEEQKQMQSYLGRMIQNLVEASEKETQN